MQEKKQVIDFKKWYCDCGNKGWAMERLDKVICSSCGKTVKTRINIDISKLTEDEKFTLRLLQHARKTKASA